VLRGNVNKNIKDHGDGERKILFMEMESVKNLIMEVESVKNVQ